MVTGIGAGFRTSPFPGSFAWEEEEDSLAQTIKTLNATLAGTTNDLRKRMRILDSPSSREGGERVVIQSEGQKTEARKRIAELAHRQEALRNELKENRKQLDRRLTLRRGFQLQLAGGLAWEAPDAVFDSTDFVRWGTTLTVAYAWPKWKAVGVVRRLEERRSSSQDATDLGARVIYASGDFGLSLEGVRRILDDRSRRFRFSGHGEYKLGPDWWLNVTIGNDFEREAEGSLLSQFGLMFNFADARYLPR